MSLLSPYWTIPYRQWPDQTAVGGSRRAKLLLGHKCTRILLPIIVGIVDILQFATVP